MKQLAYAHSHHARQVVRRSERKSQRSQLRWWLRCGWWEVMYEVWA